MSDLLSVALLFVLTLVAAIVFVKVLRGALARGVAARFADAGDVAMAEMAQPLDLTGQANCANGSGVERNQRDAMLAVCSTAVRRPAR